MNAYIHLVLGGLAPAVLWGLTAVLQKMSSVSGLSPSAYLAIFGLSIFGAGLGSSFLLERPLFPGSLAVMYAVMAGAAFALGTGLVGLALWKYNVPISRLSPLLATNVLVTVAIGLFLGEMNSVAVPKLLIGSGLIFSGVLFVISS